MSADSPAYGYGIGGYGHGYYGGQTGDNGDGMDETTYTDFGEQLAQDLQDVITRLEEIEDDIDNGGGGDGGDYLTGDEVGDLIEVRLASVREDIEGLNGSLSGLDERLGAAEKAIEDLRNSGGGGGIGEERRAAIDRELRYLRLTGRPTHRAIIDTGVPGGEYHPYGDWGQIITCHDDVRWISAVVDCESSGMTKLVVEEIDYTEGEEYDLGDVHATVELNHKESGLSVINPDIALPEGQYFISRDTDMVVPMRRVMTDVDWETVNQSHTIPVTVECSWRARANYEPGTSEFQRYRENNWHRRLYYFGDMEFGFMSAIDESEG